MQISGYSAMVGPPATSAGVVEREIENDYNAKEIDLEKPTPLLEIEVPKEQLCLNGNITVPVLAFEFQGNTVFSSASLDDLVSPFKGRNLSIKEIGEVCHLIQCAYAEKGYLFTRAYPPPQEVKEGRLSIRILEGTLGSISVVGNEFYSASFIERHISRFQGTPLNYRDLMAALLILNEYQDLNVGAVFQKGAECGQVDLILRVADARPRHLYVDTNNYGSKPITLTRTGARYDFGSLLTDGDNLSLTEVLGYPFDRLNFSNARYTIPINYRGTKVSLAYLYSGFKVNQLNPLHLRGKSQIATVGLNHAALRTLKLNIDLFLDFDYKQIQNFALSQTTAYDKLRVLGLGAHFDYLNRLGARNFLDLFFHAGIPDFLGGLKAVDSQCSRAGAGGRFYLLNGDYKWLQALPWDSFLFLHLAGQLTPNKLPLAEQIYIGGVDTARGYPLATALGDNGYYGNFELRFPLPFIANKKVPYMCRTFKDLIQIIGFVDQGGVSLVGGNTPTEAKTSLTSVGVGARVHAGWGLDFNFDAGFPLTDAHKSSDCIWYYKVSWRIF